MRWPGDAKTAGLGRAVVLRAVGSLLRCKDANEEADVCALDLVNGPEERSVIVPTRKVM